MILLRVLCFFVLLTLLAVGDFARRTQSTFDASTPRAAGVVFTGQFSRVYVGLDLLEHGRVTPLLISGANGGAGIPVAGFAKQFQLSPALKAALSNGQLVLASGADTTFQNAYETRQWLATLPKGQPVVLITSRFHMPRASAALELAVENRRVLRYVVAEEAPVTRNHIATEWAKFVWTVWQSSVALVSEKAVRLLLSGPAPTLQRSQSE
jgi:uncharacterized SAM-binding protein YcdF (DUF218 family)